MNPSSLYEQSHKLRGIVKYVYKKTGQAIFDYQMIEENDRVLLGLSGGVDSFSLLQVLLMRRIKIPYHFELFAVYVRMPWIKDESKILASYLKQYGIELIIKDIDIAGEEITCFWCSWNRRKIFFELADELSCRKIALGHNLDDIVESILMNLYFHGEISALVPKQSFFGGKLFIIRPFAYVEKKDILRFAKSFAFPPLEAFCPYAKNSQRQAVKEQLASLASRFPHIKKNIFRALSRKKLRVNYLLS